MGHLKSYPTPESFFSDMPPDRIIGEEVEYDIQAPAINDKSIFITEEAINNADLDLAVISDTASGNYLSNGARLYKDGRHLEYCSPESRGPYQAAAADIAGIQVLSAIVTASNKSHQGVYRTSGTALKDEYLREQKKTYGAHENFMIPRRIVSDPTLVPVMAAHLASRIWATNGTVTNQGYGFSQKISGIGSIARYKLFETSRRGEGAKPMMLMLSPDKDEDILHDPRWARMEVRFADPLQSLEGQRANLATTSLALRLVEHKRKFKKGILKDGFEDVALTNPLEAARLFMADLSLKETAEVKSGKQQNALAIGEQLATMAIELSTKIELPVDEADAAYTWLETIQALRRSKPQDADYDTFLLQRFDMAAKHHYLTRAGAFDQNMNVARAKSLAWDRILPTGIGQKYWRSVNGTDEEVERLQTIPPQTRAAVRGAYIAKYVSYALKRRVNWAEHWLEEQYKDRQYFSDAYGNPIIDE